MTRAVLISMLAAAPLLADPVTTSDHLSVNGSLSEMLKGVIRLEVSSRSGKEFRWIEISKVGSIEFNSTVFNAGGPPRIFGVKPPEENGKGTRVTPAKEAETIVLRGGQYKPCKLMRIDAAKVYCEDTEYARQRVLRIILGER